MKQQSNWKKMYVNLFLEIQADKTFSAERSHVYSNIAFTISFSFRNTVKLYFFNTFNRHIHLEVFFDSMTKIQYCICIGIDHENQFEKIVMIIQL